MDYNKIFKECLILLTKPHINPQPPTNTDTPSNSQVQLSTPPPPPTCDSSITHWDHHHHHPKESTFLHNIPMGNALG